MAEAVEFAQSLVAVPTGRQAAWAHQHRSMVPQAWALRRSAPALFWTAVAVVLLQLISTV